MIKVQEIAFDAAAELRRFQEAHRSSGATVMFIGTVREMSEALKRWPIEASLIIHRYGRLSPGDDIVLVITASAHRQAAFEANEFLMDWLKTKAPFWKLEESADKTHWVDAKDNDDQAARRWDRLRQ